MITGSVSGRQATVSIPFRVPDHPNIEIEFVVNTGFIGFLTILWHGQERDVEVLAMGLRPLLGTALLEGNEMNVQFADGGLVTIDLL